MKKTLSINIAGIIFHIEEDAFATLDAYIKSIHAYFETFEGSKEIIADIEARIAEKFWGIREDEKTEAISLEHVNALIASLGTVADFQALESEEDKKESNQNYSQSQSSTSTNPQSKVFRRDLSRKMIGGVASGLARYLHADPIWVRLCIIVGFFGLIPLFHVANVIFWAYIICWIAIPGEINLEEDKSFRKFYRDPERKVIGGVIAGFSAYTGWDLGLLRVLAVLSVLFFGSGIVAYLVILAISPEAKTLTDKMEMTGEPITLENIENNIKKNFQKEGEVEESTLTRILLVPFRLIAAFFGAFKGFFVALRWILQISVGIILTIFGLGSIIALITLSSVGFSGLDHGQVQIAFGEAIPLYLLANDLPNWTYLAFIAAVLPILVSIIISGVSLLANRKFYNKTYQYIATTLCIIGWIGLFIALPTVGKNFARTASVNQVEDISLITKPYILDIKKESQESIWEKMLGSRELVDEILDEEDLHDYNREGFTRAQISIEGYSGTTIQVIEFSKSNGKDRLDAEKNARSIKYGYSVEGDKIVFDSHFGITNLRFRNQRLRVKVLIPFGQSFSMTRDFAYYIENEIDGGYFNESSGDLFVGSIWNFTPEKGLTCLNREPMENKEESFHEDRSKGDDMGANFSISKDLENFQTIEALNTESASIRIVPGNKYLIRFDGTDKPSFLTEATVSNGVLKLNKLQAGIQVEIHSPKLAKVELGGNARTEINGFNQSKLEVVLHDFHSAIVEGSTDLLIASTDQNAELIAPNLTVQKAVVSLKDQSKMELQVVKSITGIKSSQADLIYPSNSNLKAVIKTQK
ncbi:PspC domain-containing protein [Aquirufa rosea]|uniref:PspC domain-containing protein n=1 Tax=Aquirufa rosea TaxID=2509241 RepID=A0A4Q1C0F8_9BACT|nr:PspC domain-containing protein [Aquirufa rosea]RXK49803.1 PspC domain-containing protein [Aquirufa rosea]